MKRLNGGCKSLYSSPMLFLNTYRHSGIGDFGAKLFEYLIERYPGASYIETRRGQLCNVHQVIAVLFWPGTVVANLGLTSFGRSPVSNVLGFAVLRLRAHSKKSLVVLLHNTIEVVKSGDTGFPVNSLVERVAHNIVSGILSARIVVFGSTMASILKSEYASTPRLVFPLPSDRRGSPHSSANEPVVVVVPGYLSPYKAFDLLPEIQNSLGSRCRIVVVGGTHSLLASGRDYQRKLSGTIQRWKLAGIEFYGHVDDNHFDSLLNRADLGLLPYKNTQGASAAFASLASFGIPIVASDLPEFRWLQTQGAGVILARLDADSFSRALSELIDDHEKLSQLRLKQIDFASRYSYRAFVQLLAKLASE